MHTCGPWAASTAFRQAMPANTVRPPRTVPGLRQSHEKPGSPDAPAHRARRLDPHRDARLTDRPALKAAYGTGGRLKLGGCHGITCRRGHLPHTARREADGLRTGPAVSGGLGSCGPALTSLPVRGPGRAATGPARRVGRPASAAPDRVGRARRSRSAVPAEVAAAPRWTVGSRPCACSGASPSSPTGAGHGLRGSRRRCTRRTRLPIPVRSGIAFGGVPGVSVVDEQSGDRLLHQSRQS
jgi:hypothetical protein